MRLRLLVCFLSTLLCFPAFAQKQLSGSAEILKSLDQLKTLGSVLMIAAHPDDENTALIAYYARGRNMRTGYLSLTRGEGGQNLIGAEQGEKIGIIRTQELMAARKIDGGEQMFGRMIDFGFSKTADETIEKWGRQNILADMVWNIRRFRPDVIVLRFSGTPRDGHGHHQTSAQLAKDAFAMAADPKQFPEQLKYVETWQTKRMYFNLFAFLPEHERENEKVSRTIVQDYGEFDPVLGYSYSEIAGMSRSQHRSQAMGAPERKGAVRNHLLLLAGDPVEKDPFHDIDTTWNRIGAPQIGKLIEKARQSFVDTDPTTILPALLEARTLIAERSDYWSKIKLREIDETIALCAGLWVDASAERAEVVPGSTIKISLNAINRSKVAVSLAEPALQLEPNRMATYSIDWAIPADQPLSQPYWLREPRDGTIYRVPKQELNGLPETPADKTVQVKALVLGKPIMLERPVHYRYVDRAEGELVRPMVVVPAVGVALNEKVLLFPSPAPKPIEVSITAKVVNAKGTVSLQLPQGWQSDPASLPFSTSEVNEQATLRFNVTPLSSAVKGIVTAVATLNGHQYSNHIEVIRYSHIPPQTLFPSATADLVPLEVKVLSKRVGYFMGAGDSVPDSLREMGCTVTMLSGEDLARGNLAQFDAIVLGIRAYNTKPELRANFHRLNEYVSGGGTVVSQYNVADNRFWAGGQSVGSRLGPLSLQIGNGRIVDETAAVKIIDPENSVLKQPNLITAQDWDGWIQERGLYFANKWDPKYQPLFRMKDANEDPQDGGTLILRHGKGTYIYTSLAFFRQLPAGVPGAYRLFANFLSAGKVTK